MSKKTLVNIAGIIALTVITVLVVGGFKSMPNVGGTFNPVVVDFAEGISVDGTTIINGSGAFTGQVTGNLTKPVLTPTADTTLTVEQSGSIVNLGTAGVDVTLPSATASAGVGYKFVVSALVATTNMTIVGAPADLIEGSLIVAGAVVDCDASDVITVVVDGENIGDFVEVYSNGTKWMIGASGALTASKMTCTG